MVRQSSLLYVLVALFSLTVPEIQLGLSSSPIQFRTECLQNLPPIQIARKNQLNAGLFVLEKNWLLLACSDSG